MIINSVEKDLIKFENLDKLNGSQIGAQFIETNYYNNLQGILV